MPDAMGDTDRQLGDSLGRLKFEDVLANSARAVRNNRMLDATLRGSPNDQQLSTWGRRARPYPMKSAQHSSAGQKNRFGKGIALE